jgi:hypothetical protein
MKLLRSDDLTIYQTFFTGDRMDKDIHHSFEEMNNALKSMMYADS